LTGSSPGPATTPSTVTDVLGLWNLFDGSSPAKDLEQAGRLSIDASPAIRRKVLSAVATCDG
jgi:hypothetical protein